MPAGLVLIGIAGALAGIIALTLATVRQMSNMPHLLDYLDDAWPYTEVDYLWWDEGICWAAR